MSLCVCIVYFSQGKVRAERIAAVHIQGGFIKLGSINYYRLASDKYVWMTRQQVWIKISHVHIKNSVNSITVLVKASGGRREGSQLERSGTGDGLGCPFCGCQ